MASEMYESRTYRVSDDDRFGGEPSGATVAAYKADDWLARKQWGNISTCGWILIAVIAIVLISIIIAIANAMARRGRRY